MKVYIKVNKKSHKFNSKSWFELKNGKLEIKKANKKTLETYIKRDNKIIKFDDAEIEKYKFYQHETPILIENADINKTVVSNKVSFGIKNFK